MDEHQELRGRLAELEAELAVLGRDLAGVTSTRGWRLLEGLYYRPIRRLRAVLGRVRRFRRSQLRVSAAASGRILIAPEGERMSRSRRRAIHAAALAFVYRPTVSMLMPLSHHDAPGLLARTATALDAQLYPDWELIVAVHPDYADYAEKTLLRRRRAGSRIRIARAAMHAVEADLLDVAFTSSEGEAICVTYPGDLWPPAALVKLVAALNRDQRPEVVYGDELLEDPRGELLRFPKPAWSPEYFLATGYVGNTFVVDRAAVESAGGFRREYHPAEEIDLLLRVTERGARVSHVREVVHVSSRTRRHVSGRGAARRRVVEAALARRGEPASVSEGEHGVITVHRTIARDAGVSAVIAFRDGVEILRRCVESVLAQTNYDDLELVLVDNGSRTESMAAYLATLGDDPRVRMLRVAEPFNFSELCNSGAAMAKGRYLLFLNDDTEVVTSGWLKALVEQGQRPQVGAVGGKLLYSNNSIQHAGIALGQGDGTPPVPIHAYRHERASAPGEFATLSVPREVSAVTGACLLTRRALFEDVGGFDAQHLPVEYNDIDYCLKVRARGYAVIYTPYAELYHLERQTRGRDEVDGVAARRLHERWGAAFSEEIYTRVGVN